MDRPADPDRTDPAPGGPPPAAQGFGQFKLATVFAVMALVAAVLLLARPANRPGPLPWEPYTKARLDEHIRAGRIVVVRLHASWSLQCALIQRETWKNPSLNDEFQQRGVALLDVDFTTENPAGEDLMDSLGIHGFPAAAVYRPGGAQPKVLLDIIEVAEVQEAIR